MAGDAVKNHIGCLGVWYLCSYNFCICVSSFGICVLKIFVFVLVHLVFVFLQRLCVSS